MCAIHLPQPTAVARVLTTRPWPIHQNGLALALWYHTQFTTASRFWAGTILQWKYKKILVLSGESTIWSGVGGMWMGLGLGWGWSWDGVGVGMGMGLGLGLGLEWVSKRASERVTKWFTEWMSGWLSVSDWVRDQANDWASEWMSQARKLSKQL